MKYSHADDDADYTELLRLVGTLRWFIAIIIAAAVIWAML